MNEGDSYNAANTNAEIDALLADINALSLDTHVEPRALDRQHLVGLLADDASTDSNKGDGMQVSVAAADWPGTNAFEQYSNALSPDGANPKNFQVFLAGAGGRGPGGGVGWRRIARAGGAGNECKTTWPGGTTIGDYERVMVTASIAIGDAIGGEGVANIDNCFSLAIAVKDDGANYYCVERSIRNFTGMTVSGQRLSITTFLTQADLDAAAVAHGGTATITEALLVFGRWESATGGAISAIDGVGYIELGPYNISQLPMRAGALA
jgi:hypothetical protein